MARISLNSNGNYISPLNPTAIHKKIHKKWDWDVFRQHCVNFPPTGRDPNMDEEHRESLVVQEFIGRSQTAKYCSQIPSQFMVGMV